MSLFYYWQFKYGPLSNDRFKNMSDAEWDAIMAVHLKGAYACTKAAWPHFRKQKFGRVINTASAAGLYGAFPFSLFRDPQVNRLIYVLNSR